MAKGGTADRTTCVSQRRAPAPRPRGGIPAPARLNPSARAPECRGAAPVTNVGRGCRVRGSRPPAPHVSRRARRAARWIAGAVVAALALFALGVLWPLPAATPVVTRHPVAFVGATVVDVERGVGVPGRTVVVHHAAHGVEAIKVYDRLPRGAYLAIVDEARRLGLDVVGHRPLAVSAVEAAAAGHKSVDHARVFLHEGFGGAPRCAPRPAGGRKTAAACWTSTTPRSRPRSSRRS